ncbi:hypothetical protein LAZ67_15000152 [Cordylochernes scorpioides]|uniref:Uncharacterized protein n=1 Tax=Cordylochernes scorpioides TaxID=51811 RepID=A0ABY6L7S6_9ARAC|nr:hypothetical protein LAZ67_15000152 [Cordylochernes scorpioides]
MASNVGAFVNEDEKDNQKDISCPSTFFSKNSKNIKGRNYDAFRNLPGLPETSSESKLMALSRPKEYVEFQQQQTEIDKTTKQVDRVKTTPTSSPIKKDKDITNLNRNSSEETQDSPQFQPHPNRESGTSIFGFSGTTTLVSYVPKKKSVIRLIKKVKKKGVILLLILEEH